MFRALCRFSGRAEAALAFTLTLLVLSACGGGGGDPTPTPSTSPATPFAPSGEPSPAPPDTAYRFLYREFGSTQDVVWSVNAKDPSQREQIAAVPHREGWGVKPALSPDGKVLVYLSQPEGALNENSSQAEAYAVDLETKETTLLVKNVDLGFTPLWSPDGKSVYLRRYAGPEFLAADVIILNVDVPRKPKEGEATPTPTATPAPDATPNPEPNVHIAIRDRVAHVLSFTPVGFSADGNAMYFIQIEGGTGGGTLLGAFDIPEAKKRWALEGQPTPPPEAPPTPVPAPLTKLVAQLSAQIARDYDLSRDGNRLAFVVQDLVEGQFVQRAYVTDLISTASSAVPVSGLALGDHVQPRWHPDNARVALGVVPGAGSAGSIALVPVAGGGGPSFLVGPRSGFDVAQAWAPDGTYLAVISYGGRSLADPGTATLELLSNAGHRITLGAGADVEILGWFQPPPPESPSPS